LVPLTFQQRVTLRTGDMRIKYGRIQWTCSSFQFPICRRLLPLRLATAAKRNTKQCKAKINELWPNYLSKTYRWCR